MLSFFNFAAAVITHKFTPFESCLAKCGDKQLNCVRDLRCNRLPLKSCDDLCMEKKKQCKECVAMRIQCEVGCDKLKKL